MRSRALVPFLLALASAASAASGAAELGADCKPPFSAMEKSLQADHTTVTTHGGDTMRGVTLGGQTWLQVHGAWRKSPVTPQQNIAMTRENLKDAKQFSCKALPDAVVDGTPVAVYATHTVSGDDDVMDSRVAVARSTGLVVSVENRQGGEATASLVTRYAYGNVKAPM